MRNCATLLDSMVTIANGVPQVAKKIGTALKEQFPDKVIEIGNVALGAVRNPKVVHIAEQYICALMGYSYYKKAKIIIEQMPALM